MPHKIHQPRKLHRHNIFQPPKSHLTHHHTCWQSDGSNSRLFHSNKRLGKQQRIQRNERADSYHRARDATQNIYCNNTYDNNVRSRKLEGAAVQHQQHMTDNINDAIKSSSTPIFHAISSEGGTVNKNKTWTHKEKHKTTFHTTAPGHNTRSQTQAAQTPPASRTRALTQFARLENKTLDKKRTSINSRCNHCTTGKRHPPSFGGHGHRYWETSQL